MSLRSGFSQFLENTRQWGLRTGTSLRNFYNQARQVAHKVRPHLEKGTKFIEGVNVHAQRELKDPKHKAVAQTWTSRLRNLTDQYGTALEKADRYHNIIADEWGAT